MLQSIISSMAPLFSTRGGAPRTENQGHETSMTENNTSVEAMKVCNPISNLHFQVLFRCF